MKSESVINMDNGNLHVEVERHGLLIHEEVVRNKVVATGRDIIRDLLLGVGSQPDWIAVGTTSTAVADTDIALGAEYFRGRITRRLSNTGKATFKLHLTTSDANGQTIREVGAFVHAVYTAAGSPLGGGRLFARALVTPIVKDNTVTVTFTWEFPISST